MGRTVCLRRFVIAVLVAASADLLLPDRGAGGLLPAVLATELGHEFTAWSPAVNLESVPGTDPTLNTAFNDGCPIVAPGDRMLFLASNRPGGFGGQDIWVAFRESADAPWGAPVNVGAPVNSAFDDFCPSPTRDGHLFFFVSTRPGGCGGADIYVTRWRNDIQGWEEPLNLGCNVNSAGNEASPVLVMPARGPALYFSSNRPGGFSTDAPDSDDDIYVAEWHGGAFLPAQLVPDVNTAFNDSRPNLSHDGRDLFFDSNRVGTLGGPDIYHAYRAHVNDSWSTPENLGPLVNSSAAETRPSLSFDGAVLVFGSMRSGGEGSNDIYMTTRSRITGQ